jgi:hypothetical protein
VALAAAGLVQPAAVVVGTVHITVTAAPATGTGGDAGPAGTGVDTGASGGSLPTTGADLVPAVLLAIALLVFGRRLQVVARRR